MVADLILLPRPAARTRAWTGLPADATVLLRLDQVDELGLVAHRVEVGVVQRVDPVALVARDGPPEGVDGPGTVALQRSGRRERVEDLVGLRLAREGLFVEPDRTVVLAAIAVVDAEQEVVPRL